MSDYEENIEMMIEHLRDDDHAAAYLGTLKPAANGSDFEVLATVDSDRIDSGSARLELLAHHVLVLSEMTDLSPREIAMNIVAVIEEREQSDSHDVEPVEENDDE
jgi:hypothetical protein